MLNVDHNSYIVIIIGHIEMLAYQMALIFIDCNHVAMTTTDVFYRQVQFNRSFLNLLSFLHVT